jgi:hypothetical protein
MDFRLTQSDWNVISHAFELGPSACLNNSQQIRAFLNHYLLQGSLPDYPPGPNAVARQANDRLTHSFVTCLSNSTTTAQNLPLRLARCVEQSNQESDRLFQNNLVERADGQRADHLVTDWNLEHPPAIPDSLNGTSLALCRDINRQGRDAEEISPGQGYIDPAPLLDEAEQEVSRIRNTPVVGMSREEALRQNTDRLRERYETLLHLQSGVLERGVTTRAALGSIDYYLEKMALWRLARVNSGLTDFQDQEDLAAERAANGVSPSFATHRFFYDFGGNGLVQSVTGPVWNRRDSFFNLSAGYSRRSENGFLILTHASFIYSNSPIAALGAGLGFSVGNKEFIARGLVGYDFGASNVAFGFLLSINSTGNIPRCLLPFAANLVNPGVFQRCSRHPLEFTQIHTTSPLLNIGVFWGGDGQPIPVGQVNTLFEGGWQSVVGAYSLIMSFPF